MCFQCHAFLLRFESFKTDTTLYQLGVSVSYSFFLPEINIWDQKVKISVHMKHFCLSLRSSREQAIQNTVNAWHHDTSNSWNGLPVFHPKTFVLGWSTWHWLSVRDGGSLNCLAGQEYRWYHWRFEGGDFSYLTFPCLAFRTSS